MKRLCRSCSSDIRRSGTSRLRLKFALAISFLTLGCSNGVHQIPISEMEPDGTYLVASLRNEMPPRQEYPEANLSANVTITRPVTAPGVDYEASEREIESSAGRIAAASART